MGTDIEAMKTDSNDRPLKTIKIANCGELKPGDDLGINCTDGTSDIYPHHPEDLDLDWYLQTNFPIILEIVTNIKDSGNTFYRAGDHQTATDKYKKCCKYIKMLRDSVGSTDDDEELDYAPEWVSKARYRRGQAQNGKQNFDLA